MLSEYERDGQAAPARAAHHPALALAILATATFLAALDLFIVNVALPEIGNGMGESALSDLSWVLNAYAIIYAALLVPAGRLADRFGRKEAFVLGVATFAVASIGCALSDNLWSLVGFRCAQAAGAALLTPASLGLLLTTAPEEKRETYVRIWAATGALAAATGPVIGGLLVELSWRWIFLVNIPIGLLAIVGTLRVIPNVRHDLTSRLPDLLGGAVLIVVVGALALGMVQGPDWGWGAASTITCFAVSALTLALFVWRSARHPAPIVQLSLFRSSSFSWSNAASLLFFAAFAPLLLSAILWMQEHWHYSAIKTGLAIAPGPLMVPVFAVVAENLTRRVRVGVVSAVGNLLIAAGALFFVGRLGADSAYVKDFLPGWLLTGIGVGLALPTITSSATLDLPPAQSATGSAVLSMFQQVGSVIGTSLLVAVLGAASAAAGLHTFRSAWWLTVGIAILAALAAIGTTPRNRQPAAG